MKRIKMSAFIRRFVSYFSPFEVLKAFEFYPNEKFYMGINIVDSPSKPVMLSSSETGRVDVPLCFEVAYIINTRECTFVHMNLHPSLILK